MLCSSVLLGKAHDAGLASGYEMTAEVRIYIRETHSPLQPFLMFKKLMRSSSLSALDQRSLALKPRP